MQKAHHQQLIDIYTQLQLVCEFNLQAAATHEELANDLNEDIFKIYEFCGQTPDKLNGSKELADFINLSYQHYIPQLANAMRVTNPNCHEAYMALRPVLSKLADFNDPKRHEAGIDCHALVPAHFRAPV